MAHPKYCGDRYAKMLKQVCAFQGESKPCLKNIISLEEQLQRKCCDQGCSFDEAKGVCCFTQQCLDRCYPGKGYRMGQVY
uniref:Uncharacterized protein n=1 Tax=Acrobeloides nanus TaxID=290746 RepID=A0A914EBR2_9BILA